MKLDHFHREFKGVVGNGAKETIARQTQKTQVRRAFEKRAIERRAGEFVVIGVEDAQICRRRGRRKRPCERVPRYVENFERGQTQEFARQFAG